MQILANQENLDAMTAANSADCGAPLRKGTKHKSSQFPVFLVLALGFFSISMDSAAQTKQAHPVITKISQAQELKTSPSFGTRLHLTGVITYYDTSAGVLYLQDATGGIRVKVDNIYKVNVGDKVELTGIPASGFRTEVANDPDIKVIGHGIAPPQSIGYKDLAVGHGEAKLVSVRGKIVAANQERRLNVEQPYLKLDLLMAEGKIEVHLHTPSSFHPESFLNSAVEINGVASNSYDVNAQLTGIDLYVAEVASIHVEQKPDAGARQLPLTSIDNIMQSRAETDTSHPVRVRGRITYYKSGDSAVLESDGKSINVQTWETGDLALGDVVDATGYLSNRDSSPSLRQAALVKTGSHEAVVAQSVTFAAASSGKYADDLVSINGKVVSELQDSDSYTITVSADGHLVSAYLEQNVPVQELQLGSVVRITGICRVLPGGASRAAHLSHLEMRSIDDVQVLSQPSWFTREHFTEFLGGLTILAFAIAIWAAFLKRRVSNQTAWIDRSVTIARERSRILEMITSNHMLEELLTEICKSTAELLPGAECSYYLHLDDAETEKDTIVEGNANLFEVALTDSAGEIKGRIVVSTPDEKALAPDREQIFEVLSECAALAMRQSLLYRGLVHHSTHDPLTGLPNRRLCESRMDSALREAELNGGQLAVIYIDINKFKPVNDKFGHKVGDLYLQQIAHRLQGQIRPIDMLARIGGDEFVVIAPFPEGFDRSYALTGRLQACFDEPFSLDGEIIEGSASFGFARFPEHGTTAEDLTRHADHAMYVAKNTEARASEGAHGLAIITSDELELALLRNRFRLAYQPQFSAEGRLTGLEALIRLDDPVLGIITPDAFITVAERHPVIVGIGDWALRCALQDATRWKLHEGDPLLLAVNVSVRQLEEPGYADSVLACLAEFSFPPERLEIELIERSLMFSGDNVANQLEQLRAEGLRIALDDFGTGQSCLSLLHRLPIDTIKLDRSFIRAMDDEPTVLPIVRAIVSMAHSLGKRTVAEAIEHIGPVQTLLAMGEMDFQGFLLSKPIPAEDVHTFINEWRAGIVMPSAFRIPVQA